MSERMDTVSVALPSGLMSSTRRLHWEVRMKKGALMREVLLGYAAAKIAERSEESHPHPGPVRGPRHRGELIGDVVGAYRRMRPGPRQ